MNDSDRDLLDRNLERLLRECPTAPSEARIEESCRRFLERIEAAPRAVPEKRPRQHWEVLTVAAALLLSALLLWMLGVPRSPQDPLRKENAAQENRAVNGLKLSLSLPKEKVPFKEPLVAEATFENVSDKPVTYFVGLEVRDDFPALTVAGKSGTYAPEGFLGGIMLPRGIQGSLVTLAAGEKKSYTITAARFVSADGGVATGDALPSGTYAVSVAYAQADDKIPYDDGPRKSEGLWTGSVASRALRFVVDEPTGVEARLSMSAAPGALDVAISNHLKRDIDLRCTATLSGHCKYLGLTGTATITLDGDGANLEKGKTFPLALRRGETKTWRLNLAALTFTPDRARAGKPFGLSDLAGRDFFLSLAIACQNDAEIASIAPNPILLLETQSPISDEAMAALVKKLGSEDIGEREAAMTKLSAIPLEKLPLLEDALASGETTARALGDKAAMAIVRRALCRPLEKVRLHSVRRAHGEAGAAPKPLDGHELVKIGEVHFHLRKEPFIAPSQIVSVAAVRVDEGEHGVPWIVNFKLGEEGTKQFAQAFDLTPETMGRSCEVAIRVGSRVVAHGLMLVQWQAHSQWINYESERQARQVETLLQGKWTEFAFRLAGDDLKAAAKRVTSAGGFADAEIVSEEKGLRVRGGGHSDAVAKDLLDLWRAMRKAGFRVAAEAGR